MLNQPIVAQEGRSTVRNSTFVLLLQFPRVALSQLQQTNVLTLLILNAGAGGPASAPGTDVVSGGQMFLQSPLVGLAGSSREIFIAETAGPGLESQSKVSFLQDCHDMLQSRLHVVQIIPVLYFALQKIKLGEKNI